MPSTCPEHQAILDPAQLLLIDQRKSLKAGQVQNITWATFDYEALGPAFSYHAPITADLTYVIKPRVLKAQQEQDRRKRSKAEVYTPSWMCNAQNNLVDDQWFGGTARFNTTQGATWHSCPEPIIFAQGKTWQDYVSAKRLEVTCGEAPYLVSRYDAVTGAPIPVSERIGLLDRKLRVTTENTKSPAEWLKWAHKAFQSVYGFELQGDSLFVARSNLLLTFSDFYEERWGEHPEPAAALSIATIITWNLFQMDALSEDWEEWLALAKWPQSSWTRATLELLNKS